MAKDVTGRDMTKDWRPVHGPRPVGALVPAIVRPAFARAVPGAGGLMEAWPGIVGPALADATAPRRLGRGTLTIACSGPVALELQHLSAELTGRINQYLGSQTVQRLRFVQTQLPRPPARAAPPTNAAGKAAGEAAAKTAAAAVADLPEGPLRTALANLGRAVITESASRLGKQPRTRY